MAWDKLDIAYAVSDPQATGDTVDGTPDIDVLDGGAGNDLLKGGADSDLYLFDAGYGQDTINDLNGNITLEHMDIVEFGPGIARADAILGREGKSKDLQITFAGSSDSLTVEGQFAAADLDAHNRTYISLKNSVSLHRSDYCRRSWNGRTHHLRFGHLGQPPAPLSAYVQ